MRPKLLFGEKVINQEGLYLDHQTDIVPRGTNEKSSLRKWESRIGHYLYGEFPNDEYVTWGCNAIYRDIDVMNLVSVDYGMQLEIYDSGYAHNHKCWFGDWNIIPAYFDGDENILVDKLIKENKTGMVYIKMKKGLDKIV